MSKSYRPMMLVQGEWAGNGLRFATPEEAAANAKDLMRRWTLVRDYRADESGDPVTHSYNSETRELREVGKPESPGHVAPDRVRL